jgi:alkylated DNA repair dioxygenase AlkB
VALKGIKEQPEGFRYQLELVSPAEELDLIELAAGLDMHPVVLRDQPSKRLVRHFGYGYDYESWTVREGEPLPPALEPLRLRAEEFAGLEEGSLVEALVTFYPVGAGINWHRDAAAFGDHIGGVSLGAPCKMQLRRGEGAGRAVFEQTLEPRSAYLLSGPARREWQHHIPATKGDRYSITFRTVRAIAEDEVSASRSG